LWKGKIAQKICFKYCNFVTERKSTKKGKKKQQQKKTKENLIPLFFEKKIKVANDCE